MRETVTHGPQLRRILVAMLVGAALLGAVAVLLAGTRTESYSSAALVTLTPDQRPSGDPENPVTQDGDRDRFLQNQLVYLNQSTLEASVREQLGGDEVALTAARVGESDVVSISAQDADAARAVAEANAAATFYVERRRAAAAAAFDNQLNELDAQRDAATELVNGPGAADEIETPAETVNRNRLQILQGQISALQVAQTGAGAGAVVTEAASGASVSGDADPIRWAVAGALLGALIALGTLLTLSRLSRKVQGTGDVEALGVPVLGPVLPRARGEWARDLVRRTPSPVQRAVQLQHSQLRTGEPGDPWALVVVGTESGVGTSFVAAQHAAHQARRSRTLLVCAGDVVHGGLARSLGVDADAPGLVQLAHAGLGGLPLEDVVRDTRVPGLSVLPAGTAEGDGLGALERLVGQGLVGALVEAGWDVVVDAPPLDRSDAGVEMARHAGRAVLVAALRRSRVEAVEDRLQLLRAAGVEVEGVVLDELPTGRRR